MTWALLIAAISFEVAATLSLKGSETRPWLYVVVVVGYTVAFLLVTAVLKRGMGIGITYGIWAAAGVAMTAILSAVLFGELLTPLMIVGLALVIVGVVLIETAGGTDTSDSTEATTAP